MSILRVDNVEEAVLLATELQQQGKYDWFRGQVQNHRLRSAYTRRTPAEQEAVLARLGLYEHWVQRTPGLESLAQNADARIAVAQHYGIPSNFIDFTTDPAVAGFFASDRVPSEPSDPSCIMCLNTGDLADFWKSMPSKYPPPEFLRLDVPNLWRLEAQAGVFLFCPYANFEDIYDLDRILFPYTRTVSKPKPDEIYPTRKSQLEILLDQYFMIEKLRQGDRYIQEQVARGVWSVHSLNVSSVKQRWSPELVLPNGPPPLGSWQQTALQPWLNPKREHYSQARSPVQLAIAVPSQVDRGASSRETFRSDVANRVSALALQRGSLVTWGIELDSGALTESFASRLSEIIARLWDGLRVLPYSIEDISAAIANCILLAMIARSAAPASTPDPWRDAASRVFGNAIEVEFGSDDGSYARAYVGTASLLEAVRSDIADFLNPEYSPRLQGNMTGLLQAVQAPNRLFEFERFAKVFARELVPVQVLMRGSTAIFYSPARLDAFGLP